MSDSRGGGPARPQPGANRLVRAAELRTGLEEPGERAARAEEERVRARRDALAARTRQLRAQRAELRAQHEAQRLRRDAQSALAKTLDAAIADAT